MSGTESAIETVHVFVSSQVQGVWFRGWTQDEARRLGLSGWVRNRIDGRVEAVFSGPPAAVRTMLQRCRQGPPAARVDDIAVEPAAPPADPGFRMLATA